MLNEEEGDKEDEDSYKGNPMVKPDHVLEQPQEICKEPTRQEIGYAILTYLLHGAESFLRN